jgi:hypothetical protein
VLTRQLNAFGVLLLAAALAMALTAGADATLRSAIDQLGERWYRLMLNDRHVGYLHARTTRDVAGRWRSDSDLRFVLSEGAPVRVAETLLFDATPPWPLVEATQRTRRAGRDGGRTIAGADVAFTLRDHLALETWLREQRPPADTAAAATALDFDRAQVVSRQFRVVDRNGTGYQMSHGAPLDATVIQLDARMQPVSMSLSGLFTLERVSRRQALAPRTVLQAQSYYVPVDRRLPNHTEILSLTLEVEGGVNAATLWPELASGSTLERAAAAVSDPRLSGDELTASDTYPSDHPAIRALAERAVAGAVTGPERAAALTGFVHGFLHYRDGADQRGVLELLDHREGDCTEYADLLTTLARSLGIPARTVFGLAYADEAPPSFRFHAWNELRVDGRWLVLDPTWNQLAVDATHIPLPSDPGRALQLLTGAMDVRFSIRDVVYR